MSISPRPLRAERDVVACTGMAGLLEPRPPPPPDEVDLAENTRCELGLPEAIAEAGAGTAGGVVEAVVDATGSGITGSGTDGGVVVA